MAARDIAFGDGPPWVGRVERRDRTSHDADGDVSGVLSVEHAVERFFFYVGSVPQNCRCPICHRYTYYHTTLDNGRPPPRCAQSVQLLLDRGTTERYWQRASAKTRQPFCTYASTLQNHLPYRQRRNSSRPQLDPRPQSTRTHHPAHLIDDSSDQPTRSASQEG